MKYVNDNRDEFVIGPITRSNMDVSLWSGTDRSVLPNYSKPDKIFDGTLEIRRRLKPGDLMSPNADYYFWKDKASQK